MLELVAVWLAIRLDELLTVTLIGPLAAPLGTAVVRLVDVAAVTVAAVPLNDTALFARVAPSKLVPVIVTVVPSGPICGLKLAIVGTGTVTVKEDELVADADAPVTETFSGPMTA